MKWGRGRGERGERREGKGGEGKGDGMERDQDWTFQRKDLKLLILFKPCHTVALRL